MLDVIIVFLLIARLDNIVFKARRNSALCENTLATNNIALCQRND